MASTVDIVLLKANNQKKSYQVLAKDFSGIEPPLWLAVTAAYLRDQGFSVSVIDAAAENLDTRETADKVLSMNPVLLGVVVSGTNPSASTLNMPAASEVVRELKGRGASVPTAISGLHPSALPEETLNESPTDFVVVGEGFSTYKDLLSALKAGQPLDGEFDIRGLWYRREGKVVSHPRAENVQDLGALPMAAWDLLPMDKYRAHNWHCFDDIEKRQPYAVIYTSLGCPFTCSFCCINCLFGGPGIRYRPLDKVAEEVDYLVKTYGVRNIKVLDEIFALKKDRVEEFCDRMIALKADLNFWVYGRIDTVQEDQLAKMKKAGINWIAYGIEAGSKKVRDGVSKGRFDQEKIIRMVEKTHAAGIEIVSNFIFGLPDDDMETMQETLDLAKETNCAYANFYCAMAYPGSQLYDDAVARGIPLPQTWSGYSQFGEDTFPLATKHLTGGQVLRFRDEAFNDYYNDPRYLARIKQRFGPKTVNHIKDMCAVKLKRKYYDPPSAEGRN